MSENDDAWRRFFDDTSTLKEIDERGYCYVSAQRLKQVAKREPRLLAKLDRSSDLPKTFANHDLTIFPVKNGEYVIFRDAQRKTYYPINRSQYDVSPVTYTSKVDLKGFDSFPGIQRLNESQALDFAFVSSLLREFTGDPDLHLVIRGRTFTGTFGFDLPGTDHRVAVTSVQIEIDGGYESRDAIYLIEAKTGRRDDFHIRQLYYPYLEWTTRSPKRIVPILLVFTNGKFHFLQLRFNQDFGDLGIERTACYVVNETPITYVNFSDLFKRIAPEIEPSVPFPQANDLDKIVDLVSFIDTNAVTRDEVANYFEFDERQGDYYGNAAIYLGFAKRSSDGFAPTDLGKKFIGTQSLSLRTEMLVEQMLRRPVFREVLSMWGQRGFDLGRIGQSEIARVISRHTTLSGATPPRRASTVRQWLSWVARNCILQQ